MKADPPAPETALTPDRLKGLSRKFDLTLVSFLDLSGMGLVDAAPLALCLNLKFLNVANNRLASLAPVAKLAALQFVDARQNCLTELGCFGQLDQLFKLSLEGNRIAALSEVFQLKSLKSLAFLSLKTPNGELTNEVCGAGSYRRQVLDALSHLQALDYLGREDEELAVRKDPDYVRLEEEIREFDAQMARDFGEVRARQTAVLGAIEEETAFLSRFEARIHGLGTEVGAFSERVAAVERQMAAFLAQV